MRTKLSIRCTVRVALLAALAVMALAAPVSAHAAGRSRKKWAVNSPDAPNPVLTLTPGMAGSVAGTGVAGYAGDGGPATAAQFNFPSGMGRDAQGNLYVADAANSVIRKFSVGGAISTVAGNGTQGYSGDGGPATQAQLAFPTGVAVDSAGNLFIADFFNACVRKVDASGNISTLVSAAGFLVRGVAVDGSGNVYYSGWFEGVWKVDTLGGVTRVAGNGTPGFGGDGGPATSAQTAGVAGLAVDSQGNLYFAEVTNSDIRKVSAGGTITTVAGNQQFGYSGDGAAATSARLNGPTDVRVDAGGNLYIVDSSNNVIRKVNAAGTISTIAGDGNYGFAGDSGPADVMQFAGLTSVVLDNNGHLYVADTGNSLIRRDKVDSSSYSFGSVAVGQSSAARVVTVSNAGAANLHISSIVATAGFSVQSTCSTSSPLAPGADCPLNIAFSPVSVGNATGTVTVTDDANGSPHVISVQGVGTAAAPPDFSIAMSGPSLAIGRQNTASITANVTPAGGFTGNITLTCSGMPSHAACSFNPSSLHADGSNAPLSSSVTVSTGLANVAAVPHADGTYLAAITGMGTGLFGFAFLPFAWRGRKPGTLGRIVPFLLLAIILCLGLVGCGTLGGQTSVKTPAGSYTITVTAASGSTSHSSSFALVVQ